MSTIDQFGIEAAPSYPTATAEQWYAILKLEFDFTFDTRPRHCHQNSALVPDRSTFSDCWRNHRLFLNLIDSDSPAEWLENCVMHAHVSKALSVCVVPLRFEAAWWAVYAPKATEIRYPHGRLTHGIHQNGSSHKIAIFIFRPRS